MANLQSAYGLDQPVWAQYVEYVRALAHGDFGPSFKYKDFTVTELIGQGFPVTLELGTIAMSLALLLGIPIGTFAALHQNSAADYATMSLAVVGIAIPSFVVLPFLGLFFGIYLHWLPVAGWEPGLDSASCAARHRARAAAARLHRAAHARRHARSAAQSFHPHRDREGSAAAYGDFASRAAPGARAGGGLSGAGGGLDHDRLVGGGVDRRDCRASAATWCKAPSIAITRW